MEEALNRKPTLKGVLHWIIQVLGTFLFVFLIMHSIVVSTFGICALRWQIPYLAFPLILFALRLAQNIGLAKIRFSFERIVFRRFSLLFCFYWVLCLRYRLTYL